VAEEQLESPGHQGRVVVHHQVQQHPQEYFATHVVQIKDDSLLAISSKDLLSLLPNPLQVYSSNATSLRVPFPL